jgi:serine/threonine protein kinase
MPFATLAEIGYQLAHSYKALHLAGLCYCDISKGNMLFDPNTGNILICDNDNVGENGKVKSQVLGTWEFMAPEVILRQADPSTLTDLHSLAVLLFYLWTCHHPFHGNLECAIRSWDIPAKRRIYGENPVFIFDPNDTSNRPDDPDYETVRKLWELCPKKIKDLFVKAFTEGLRAPGNRVTEGEWQRAFLQLKENNLMCPHCSAEDNLWARKDGGELLCKKCKKKISIPGYLDIGQFYLALVPGVKLKASHLKTEWSNSDILGEMVENPNNPGNWGIRNHTQDTWTITFADGEIKEVSPGRAAPLSDKLSFTVKGVQVKIVGC